MEKKKGKTKQSILLCSVIKGKGNIKPFCRKQLTNQEKYKRAFMSTFRPPSVNYEN